MRKAILLTGGTGLIGLHIQEKLLKEGYSVHILSRSKKDSSKEHVHFFQWNVDENWVEPNCFVGVVGIIHLAGASIAQKWTSDAKQEIVNSRVQSAELLFSALQDRGQTLDVFVGASASGFYVEGSQEILTENSPKGQNFLAEVCEKWENASLQFQSVAKRVVIHRVGVVLSKSGGALEKMLPPFQFGLAPYFGNGKQYYPCIHVEDVANQFVYAVTKPIEGIYNACVESVTQKELNQQIAKAMDKGVLHLPAPKLALKTVFGEMSLIVLGSWNMSGKKIQSVGFEPQFPMVQSALNDLF